MPDAPCHYRVVAKLRQLTGLVNITTTGVCYWSRRPQMRSSRSLDLATLDLQIFIPGRDVLKSACLEA
ncbi:hypothetical protein BST61_g1296 [Cercospora zeina]